MVKAGFKAINKRNDTAPEKSLPKSVILISAGALIGIKQFGLYSFA